MRPLYLALLPVCAPAFSLPRNVAQPQRAGVVTMAAEEPPIQWAAAKPKFLSKGSQWPGSQTLVRDHMTTKVVTVPPTMSLKEAAILMNEKRITGAPVVSARGRLLGVMSRSDFLRKIAEVPPECVADEAGTGFESEDCDEEVYARKLMNLEAMEVRHAMAASPLTISPDATVLQAAQLLFSARLNRLMVTDGASGDSLVGIITSTDVVRIALCDELSELDYGDLE